MCTPNNPSLLALYQWYQRRVRGCFLLIRHLCLCELLLFERMEAKSLELPISWLTSGDVKERPLASLEALLGMTVFYIVIISIISFFMRHRRAQEKEIITLTRQINKLNEEITKTEDEGIKTEEEEQKKIQLESLEQQLRGKKKVYKPFNINFITIPHNFIMCVYSLYCFVGVTIVLYGNLKKLNFNVYSMFCDATGIAQEGMDYWVYTFYLSKFVEYLDTVFLLIKAKPVIPPENSQYLLHIYHHAITAAIVWSTIFFPFTTSWTGPFTNSFVHIIMYGYYFLTELNSIDRTLGGKFITPIQIVQFMLCMSSVIYEMFQTGCETNFPVTIFLLANYLIFFVFFVKVWVDKRKDRHRVRRTEKKKKAE
eukprot:TRINITY_DN2548_c0_g1_i1.p1 TRINITY_DN2548_c0_g1~~TRINITY_DN2548_c0_g1_i1.p1  ORF type:complete len:368 (-),score=48.39 TRINITY_DN2548_c0_g1_i1:70-1173(-)